MTKIRNDISEIMSCIDATKLDPDIKLLLKEFRYFAALLFSNMGVYSSEFSEAHMYNLTKLISQLKEIFCGGIIDVGLSTITSTRLANNLSDLYQETTHLVKTSSQCTTRGFTCEKSAL